MDKKKIIILTTQRTGSTWLITLLNNYNNIQEYGEPFINNNFINNIYSLKNQRFEYYNYINSKNLKNNIKNINEYTEYLANFKDSNIIIFKLMYSQIKKNLRLIFLLFQKENYIIHLKRKNIYESIISDIYSKQTKTKHLLSKKTNHIKKIYINKNILIKRKIVIMTYRIFFNFLTYVFFKKKTIDIDYDDLVKNKKKTLQKIYKHININIKDVSSYDTTNKIINNNYEEIIMNYDEIKNFIIRK